MLFGVSNRGWDVVRYTYQCPSVALVILGHLWDKQASWTGILAVAGCHFYVLTAIQVYLGRKRRVLCLWRQRDFQDLVLFCGCIFFSIFTHYCGLQGLGEESWSPSEKEDSHIWKIAVVGSLSLILPTSGSVSGGRGEFQAIRTKRSPRLGYLL